MVWEPLATERTLRTNTSIAAELPRRAALLAGLIQAIA